METPKVFIQPTPSGTNSLFVSCELIRSLSTEKLIVLIEAMDMFSIWKQSIADTHTGWEFVKEIPVSIIKSAIETALEYKYKCEIIGE